jgi:predicted amidohydrolase YtcJ
MQPIHATSDMDMAERYWGKRSAWAYGFKSQLDYGTRLVFGSDAPVESPNPFLGVHAAVTRRRRDGEPGGQGWHPEQRLTVQQSLEAYTLNPAVISGMGDRLGKIAPGFLADIVVLDQDPYTCLPEDLHRIKPVKTMVAGEWVYEA